MSTDDQPMIELVGPTGAVKLYRIPDGYKLVIAPPKAKPRVFEGLDAAGALDAIALALRQGMAPGVPEPESEGGSP